MASPLEYALDEYGSVNGFRSLQPVAVAEHFMTRTEVNVPQPGDNWTYIQYKNTIHVIPHAKA